MTVDRRKKGVRPIQIEDSQGVLRTYSELITMLQSHLCGDGLIPNRIVVGSEWQPALDSREERIEDVQHLVAALGQIHIPVASKHKVVASIVALCVQLPAIHWIDGENELRKQLMAIVQRLKHTTTKSRVPVAIRKKLKPAKDLPPPTSHRSV